MSTENLDNSENNKIRTGDYLQTLERGLMVIKAFKDNSSLTISESSRLTGLSRPVTRRVLLTLEELGYANSNSGRFSLTAKILSLGYSYISSLKIWEITTPYLVSLSEKIGESCSLCTLDDTEIIYVARVPVKKFLKISIGIGTRLPAYATSMGKVILAHLPPHKLDEYFKKVVLVPYTEKTCTDEKELRVELEKIRKHGWAISYEQLEEGLISIATPIKDIRGKVVAAINCSTHSGRADKEKVEKQFLPFLLETSEKINKSIDFEIMG